MPKDLYRPGAEREDAAGEGCAVVGAGLSLRGCSHGAASLVRSGITR